MMAPIFRSALMPSDLDPRRTADKARIVDIATDRTLPAYYYTDPAVQEIEKRELFFHTWQFVCHASELDGPGKFVTTAIFDQELFLVRGGDGEIRAFYNVCAHRGHPLVEGRGEQARLVCPYHAWTYDLTGQLIGVRRGKGTTSITKSEIGLVEVRMDRILDMIFVNLDPKAEPLATYAAGLADELTDAIPGLDSFVPRPRAPVAEVPMACNWKLIVDNFLECYHCETAHPTFCDMFHASDVTHRFYAHYMRQHLPSAHKSLTAAYPIDLENDLLDGNFWYLFPNTLFGQTPGTPSLTVSTIIPTGPETAIRRRNLMVAPDFDVERDKAREVFGRNYVGAEDKALCEGVQRGMRQQGFNQGLYMIDPDQENFTEEGVRFFHSRYVAALEEKVASATR